MRDENYQAWYDEYYQENEEWICICELCIKNPGRECDEYYPRAQVPRKTVGTWKDNKIDPDLSQKFEELVKRKTNEERESWDKKEGPTSKCDYCNKVPDNRLKTWAIS